MNKEEFEAFIRRNPEEARRLVTKTFKPRELLKIGNRSYVDAFKDPGSRFDVKDLIPKCSDGHNCPPVQPLRDPSKIFTDQVIVAPSKLVFLLDGKAYVKCGLPATAGWVTGGLSHGSMIQNAMEALPKKNILDYSGVPHLAQTGSLYIKQGNYSLSQRLVQPTYSQIKITGDGTTYPGAVGGTTLVSDDPAGIFMNIYPSTRLQMRDLELIQRVEQVDEYAADFNALQTFLENVNVINYPALSGIDFLSQRGIRFGGGGVNHMCVARSVQSFGFKKPSSFAYGPSWHWHLDHVSIYGLSWFGSYRHKVMDLQLYRCPTGATVYLYYSGAGMAEVDGGFIECGVAVPTVPALVVKIEATGLVRLKRVHLGLGMRNFDDVAFTNRPERLKLVYCLGTDLKIYNDVKQGVVTGIDTATVGKKTGSIPFGTATRGIYFPTLVPNVQLTLQEVVDGVEIDTVEVETVDNASFDWAIYVRAAVAVSTCKLVWRSDAPEP